jgi:probable F420-dependent oxidoreductase
MEIGVTLPQFGRNASPLTIATFAEVAERRGFASLWVSERLLWPVKPLGPYGGVPGAAWPDSESVAFDPLETLAFVAAKTTHVRLCTGVIDALFHPPLTLSKRLATVDQLSNGRLIAGLGQGWAPEEFEASGVPASRRGQGFAEYIACLRACWAPDPVQFSGRAYRIAESLVLPKPVQAGGPPILVGAYAAVAIERAARIADGLTPVAASWEMLTDAIRRFRESAAKAGRDPGLLQIAVCGASYKTWKNAAARPPLNGTIDEIRHDIDRLRSLDVDHVYFAVNYDHSTLEEQLQRLDELTPLLR